LDKLIIKIISLSKLYEKGPPKLDIISMNQTIENLEENLKLPPLKKYLREWDRSYKILAPKNIPEEQTPCAIITIIPPSIPHVLMEKNPTIINAICTTDEYAITTFMSLVITQIIPKIILPAKEAVTSNLNILLASIKKDSRTIPYPPSFNKIPAKIIDPDTGASTCALGSQRWTPNIGNLIKNANTKKIAKKSLPLIQTLRVDILTIFVVPA